MKTTTTMIALFSTDPQLALAHAGSLVHGRAGWLWARRCTTWQVRHGDDTFRGSVSRGGCGVHGRGGGLSASYPGGGSTNERLLGWDSRASAYLRLSRFKG